MRLAFVTPRYGVDVAGGSEARVREEAHGLAERGHDVEVLTSCALDADTWANEVAPGTEREGAVVVRRFEVSPDPDVAGRDRLDRAVLSGEPLSPAEEGRWIDARARVLGLRDHIAREGAGYDAIVYSPYLFWTTLRCLPLHPGRSVLMPCLHDEPAARLRSVRAALAGAGQVWFQSDPEHLLAARLARLGPVRVVGSAVAVPERYDAEGFRARHGLERPFALFAGRREDGKGWPEALAGFAGALDRHRIELDLVTVGAGDPQIPERLRARVHDLGFLPASEVPDAFAAAAVTLQPSRNESFSRTTMESWLAGTPVVASAHGEVVAWHCGRAGGGLLYADELEMGECLMALAADADAAAALAESGRRYVLEHYTWPQVLDAMEAALAGAIERPVTAVLEAEVRRRVAEARLALPLPDPFPDVALAEWLPRPGAGLPRWWGTRMPASAGTSLAATRSQARLFGSRAQVRAQVRARARARLVAIAERRPVTRRALAAARAARRIASRSRTELRFRARSLEPDRAEVPSPLARAGCTSRLRPLDWHSQGSSANNLPRRLLQ